MASLMLVNLQALKEQAADGHWSLRGACLFCVRMSAYMLKQDYRLKHTFKRASLREWTGGSLSYTSQF